MARVLVTDRVSEDGIEMLRTEADVDVRFGISPAELIESSRTTKPSSSAARPR